MKQKAGENLDRIWHSFCYSFPEFIAPTDREKILIGGHLFPKALLCSDNESVAEMFSDVSEEKGVFELPLPKVSEKATEAFCQLMEGGHATSELLTKENVEDVLQLASRCGNHSIATKCAHYISIHLLNNENAFEWLDKAIRLQDRQLYEFSLRKILAEGDHTTWFKPRPPPYVTESQLLNSRSNFTFALLDLMAKIPFEYPAGMPLSLTLTSKNIQENAPFFSVRCPNAV